MRRDFFKNRLRLGETCGADAMRPTRDAAHGALAGESTLCGGEARKLIGRDQVNLAVVFDITAPGSGGGLYSIFGYAPGAERERDIVARAIVHRVADDLCVAEARGVFLEIIGELGVPFFAQTRAVRGEEVEHFVAIAQPPLA